MTFTPGRLSRRRRCGLALPHGAGARRRPGHAGAHQAGAGGAALPALHDRRDGGWVNTPVCLLAYLLVFIYHYLFYLSVYKTSLWLCLMLDVFVSNCLVYLPIYVLFVYFFTCLSILLFMWHCFFGMNLARHRSFAASTNNPSLLGNISAFMWH